MKSIFTGIFKIFFVNRKIYLLLLLAYFFTAYTNYQQKSVHPNPNKTKINQDSIRLAYGFSIIGNSVLRNGKKIYENTIDTDIEYRFNTTYPILRTIGKNTFELLLQFANAPNMDIVQHFIIKNNKVIKLDTLPSFFSKPRRLADDSSLEYAALRDYRQTWGAEEWDSACYEPIIFYKVQKNGIVLDSALTIKTNKKIYGKFYGYYINEKVGFDNHRIKPKLDRAIDSLGGVFLKTVGNN